MQGGGDGSGMYEGRFLASQRVRPAQEGTALFRSLNNSIARDASEKIKEVFTIMDNNERRSVEHFAVGIIEERVKRAAEQYGFELADTPLYMSQKSILHALRPTKKKSEKSVSRRDIKSFPKNRLKMDAYIDTQDISIVYVDGRNKYVVHPNYKIKTKDGRERVVNFITATRPRDIRSAMSHARYKKI